MIQEVAILNVIPNKAQNFERDSRTASVYISRCKGYIQHALKKCIEIPNQYILLAEWESLEDHTKGFRESEDYIKWKNFLHHYYSPFPTVEHYETVFEQNNSRN